MYVTKAGRHPRSSFQAIPQTPYDPNWDVGVTEIDLGSLIAKLGDRANRVTYNAHTIAALLCSCRHLGLNGVNSP